MGFESNDPPLVKTGEMDAATFERLRDAAKWQETATRIIGLEAEIERLRAEAAKFPVQLSEVVERSTDDMNYWKARAEKAEAEHKRLHDAASELLEVANLRGDNDLPHPADDPKLWTGRMQDAWQDLAEALAQKEPPDASR